MSSDNRAPLPQSHCRRWVRMDCSESEMDDEDDSETRAQRIRRTAQNIKKMLYEATSFYDGPGKIPPKDFEKERKNIMDRLKAKFECLGDDRYQTRMELIIILALLNPIAINFDVNRFAEKIKVSVQNGPNESASDEALKKYFQKTSIGHIKDPAVLVDKFGRILLWYLPGIMHHHLEGIADATKLLKKELAASLGGSNGSWRKLPENFMVEEDKDPIFQPGSLDFSIGWFQARKDRLVDDMTPSQSLHGKNAKSWLNSMQEIGMDVDVIFSLVHSRLFDVGTQAVEQLKERFSLDEPNVKKWPCQTTGIGVIVNRKTPFHRDKGGNSTMYDILFAAGTYKSCFMELPDIDGFLEYNPGTVIALCGKVLRHGITHWEGGERICYPFYSHDNVHHRLNLPRTDWPHMSWYQEHFSTGYLSRCQL